MGWELRDFHLEQTGGLASPFQFEIQVATVGMPLQTLRGDGVVIRDSTVRFNRQDRLARQAMELGISPESFFDGLHQMVAERVSNVTAGAA